MLRRSFLFAAALAAASLIASAAQASGIQVLEDSGSTGAFRLTNLGVSGGVSTLELDFLFDGAVLQSVNGNPIANDANAKSVFVQPITLKATKIGAGSYDVSVVTPPTYTKRIGTGSDSAEMVYALTQGTTIAPRPEFLNLSGFVTNLLSNNNPAYDFSAFAAGGIHNFTLTATSFRGGAASFDDVLLNAGTSATGSGAYSQSASIPEPASMALLGIGLSGLLSFRRLVRRVTTA